MTPRNLHDFIVLLNIAKPRLDFISVLVQTNTAITVFNIIIIYLMAFLISFDYARYT
jgi:hypothetical protein